MDGFTHSWAERQSPNLSLLITEPCRALIDYLISHLPSVPLPPGDGHPVIIYPGLGAGARSTVRMRRALDTAGFKTLDWGFGKNHGPRGSVEDWLGKLRSALDVIHEQTSEKVSLVGWSLGGIYARELARRAPEIVRQVITLASPFAARPDTTHAGWLYKFFSGTSLPKSPGYLEYLREALPVPSTSIYSKSDGVVPWWGCIQARGAHSENIEVAGASHLGMGGNRLVWRIVADRLAQPEGLWRSYVP